MRPGVFGHISNLAARARRDVARTFKIYWLAVLLCATSGLAFPASPFPLQLQVRAQFAPTAFPSAGQTYVAYELYLTNYSGDSTRLQRIDVLDASEPSAAPLAVFEGKALDELLQPVGTARSSDRIGSGATVIAFMWVPIDRRTSIPTRLLHRVVTEAGVIKGAMIETHHDKLQLLTSPVRGKDWLAWDGPSNDSNNHHRRGTLAIDGVITISRRYAIDWMIQRDEEHDDIFSGDPHDIRSYYSYDQPAFAVADATVDYVRDGIPNNTPGSPEDFKHSVAITMETIGGNTVVLDIGSGHYAWYFHLNPGSIRVKPGERVRRGQRIASIGCSGDPPIPHLHFEVTTSPKLLAGEGVPYLIDNYRVWSSKEKAWVNHDGELPIAGMVVDFGQRRANGNR